mgnify:CR=1 FL=1
MVLNFFSIIIIIFPFLIVSGPLLTNLAVSLLAIYYIFILITNYSASRFLNHFIIKLILIFWLYCVVRSLLSENIYLSLEASLFYGRFIFFSLGVAYLIQKNQKILEYLTYSLLFCLLILTLDGYLQFFTGTNILGYEKINPYRVSSFFKDELILGSFLARLMPLAFFFIAIKSDKKTLFMIFALILLILQDVLIFLAGERAAFFYLVLSSILIIFLVPNFRVARIATFIISIFLIYFITTNYDAIKVRMIDKTLRDLGIGDNKKDFHIFTLEHELLYFSSIKMFKEKPIFGHGPKMFREVCKKYNLDKGCSTHPHNTYIQLLAELGIVGFLPIILLFFYIVFILTRHFISTIMNYDKYILKDEEIFLLICFCITLWPIAPTANFFTSWINSIYYFPLGFYLYLNITKK